MDDQSHVPVTLPLEGSPAPIVQEAGCAPGSVWTSLEKRKCLAPTEVRTPNHPDCSESIYRLRYPGPLFKMLLTKPVFISKYLFGAFMIVRVL